ncbi:MAG: asparagine synthase (glutamine-hydrolyzing) [Gammaproteobacteria bacterium]
MCGIAGIVGGSRCGRDGVGRMLDALRHRGPDDEGLHLAEGVALGQRRLSIIDLEGGHQPIANEDQTLRLVCNGEIYNYRELRKELEAAGHRFSTQSDSEVILHLYESVGERCVGRLRGMFAFAIWDARRRTLFAARDRLGQKPLFYAQRGQEFIFASEIKALLAFDPALAVLDEASLDQYLTLRLIAAPNSMFRAIHKLPPAHTLLLGAHGRANVSRYWDLEYEPKLQGTEDDMVDALEAEIIEALRLHVVSDVPVGAFLSGGMDSTLIVAMLMKHGIADSLETFSMGLPYQRFNEAPYARMVAERYGTVHHERVVEPSLLETLPALVWHLDEPSDPLSVCMYAISAMARERVKVVLGGDGGDELFGGYDRYYGNRYAEVYALIPRVVRRYGIGPLLRIIPDGRWYKSAAHQAKWLHRLSFLEGGERYAKSLGYFYFDAPSRLELYGPGMVSALQGDPEGAIRIPYSEARAADPVDRMLYADSRVRLPDHPVMILDRMTMAHGLEARSPLMDHGLAEFAARLPVSLKVRGRSLRYIQARLAERYLPRAVLQRPKQGFSSALPYMLATQYRALFGLFLRKSHLARDGLFCQGPIDNLVQEHLSGAADHGNRLWLLLNSEVWYRMRIEGESRNDLAERIRGVDTARDAA